MDFELEVDSTNPVDHANSDQNSTNVLETAKQNLVSYSTSNQFTIHNVPGDGDCLTIDSIDK